MFDLLSNLIGKISFLFILHVTGAGQFPKPLSEKEEKETLEKYLGGDSDAGDKLVEHNLRLVAHIVKKYYATGADPEDLVSIGTIGLMKAIRTFCPDKSIRLSSYASRCIENEILMYFRSAKKSAKDVSINEEIDSDAEGNALTLMDTMAEEDTIVEDLDIKMKRENLRRYINEVLSEREKQIINFRYGLDGKEPLAQREIAALLGISRSYVSRIEKKALLKLKKRYEA